MNKEVVDWDVVRKEMAFSPREEEEIAELKIKFLDKINDHWYEDWKQDLLNRDTADCE